MIKKKRKSFQAEWVKLPRHWLTALLQTKSANTYHLAHLILWEAFKRKYIGGEIVLSTQVTKGIPRCSKVRAAEELVELGLIRIKRDGRRSLRVILSSYTTKSNKK
jgi:hypothetical protein